MSAPEKRGVAVVPVASKRGPKPFSTSRDIWGISRPASTASSKGLFVDKSRYL